MKTLLFSLLVINFAMTQDDVVPDVIDLDLNDDDVIDTQAILAEEGQKLSENEVYASLHCFEDDGAFHQSWTPNYHRFVTDRIAEGIEDNKKYTGFIDVSDINDENQIRISKAKVVFWKTGAMIYGHYMTRKALRDDMTPTVFNREDDWRIMDNLYLNYLHSGVDVDQSGTECLKVIPEGCVYHGTTTDYYDKICKQPTELGEAMKETLVTLSVGGNDNPAKEFENFAECIKKHLNVFSFKLECALKGASFTGDDLERILNEKAAELNANDDGSGRVYTVNTDNMTIEYNEDASHLDEVQRVDLTDEDKALVGTEIELPGN